jgi:hypothetical protein
MTRDEVMAMTDEELRIKAAELDGWEVLPISSAREWIFGEGKIEMDPTKFRAWRAPTGEWGVERIDSLFVEHGKCPPNYLADAPATWKLWDKLPGDKKLLVDDYSALVQWGLGVGGHGDEHTTMSAKVDEGGRPEPRAITRAFILAMEGGK